MLTASDTDNTLQQLLEQPQVIITLLVALFFDAKESQAQIPELSLLLCFSSLKADGDGRRQNGTCTSELTLHSPSPRNPMQ